MDSLNGNWVRILVYWGISSFYNSIVEDQMKIYSNSDIWIVAVTLPFEQTGVYLINSSRSIGCLSRTPRSNGSAIGPLGLDSIETCSHPVWTGCKQDIWPLFSRVRLNSCLNGVRPSNFCLARGCATLVLGIHPTSISYWYNSFKFMNKPY